MSSRNPARGKIIIDHIYFNFNAWVYQEFVQALVITLICVKIGMSSACVAQESAHVLGHDRDGTLGTLWPVYCLEVMVLTFGL